MAFATLRQYPEISVMPKLDVREIQDYNTAEGLKLLRPAALASGKRRLGDQ